MDGQTCYACEHFLQAPHAARQQLTAVQHVHAASLCPAFSVLAYKCICMAPTQGQAKQHVRMSSQAPTFDLHRTGWWQSLSQHHICALPSQHQRSSLLQNSPQIGHHCVVSTLPEGNKRWSLPWPGGPCHSAVIWLETAREVRQWRGSCSQRQQMAAPQHTVETLSLADTLGNKVLRKHVQ